MKLLRNSLLIIGLLLSGCCSPNLNLPLTAFPIQPTYQKLTETPVLTFDKKNKTFTITQSYMNNVLMDGIFIDEIMMWKRENNIR